MRIAVEAAVICLAVTIAIALGILLPISPQSGYIPIALGYTG